MDLPTPGLGPRVAGWGLRSVQQKPVAQTSPLRSAAFPKKEPRTCNSGSRYSLRSFVTPANAVDFPPAFAGVTTLRGNDCDARAAQPRVLCVCAVAEARSHGQNPSVRRLTETDRGVYLPAENWDSKLETWRWGMTKPFAQRPHASRPARGDFPSRLPAQLSFGDVHVDSGHVGGWEVEELYPDAEVGYEVSDHR